MFLCQQRWGQQQPENDYLQKFFHSDKSPQSEVTESASEDHTLEYDLALRQCRVHSGSAPDHR
jgi:hypothetical protein